MVQAVKTITSNEGVRHLDELLAQRHLVVWLGSGISVWAPSNLPNGQKVTSDLAAVIAAQAETPTEIVCQLIKQTAFEHIMERYPRREALTEIFARAYYPTAPNAVHEAFAHLINQGVIDAVVTTNYDAGLEAACAAICAPARQPLVIVEPDDAPVGLVPPARPVILKIHGCASPARRHTMVITLSEEGELEDWKRRWLQALITGRHLLVSGYSGLDFDLCAEMALLRPDALSWNSFGNPLEQPGALTDNAQRVIKAHEGTVLVGDMKEMLTRLTGQPCLAEWGEPVSFVDELVRELNGDELLDQWRSGLFNGLGCALAALAVARRLPEKYPVTTSANLDGTRGSAVPPRALFPVQQQLSRRSTARTTIK